jgi:YHS domain-containing protein
MRRPSYVLLAVLAAAVIATGAWVTAVDEAEGGFKCVCPISGKAAKTDVSADYSGGKVYFCCPGCISGFEKNAAKYAAKANHQLAGTGQAEQTGCPISGRATNPDTALDVAGVSVSFCCNGCRGKVADAEDQLEAVFGDAAFAKAFEVKSE